MAKEMLIVTWPDGSIERYSWGPEDKAYAPFLPIELLQMGAKVVIVE